MVKSRQLYNTQAQIQSNQARKKIITISRQENPYHSHLPPKVHIDPPEHRHRQNQHHHIQQNTYCRRSDPEVQNVNAAPLSRCLDLEIPERTHWNADTNHRNQEREPCSRVDQTGSPHVDAEFIVLAENAQVEEEGHCLHEEEPGVVAEVHSIR